MTDYVYVGLRRSFDGFPYDRVAATTLDRAKRLTEQMIEQTLRWKPGLNAYWQGEPMTQTFRWLEVGPERGGGALYGSWPDWVQTLEQEIVAEQAIEGFVNAEPVDAQGICVPVPFDGCVASVYRLPLNEAEQ